MLFSVLLLALRSVLRNMLRSGLTILGIVIGVSAVITMVTLGQGATVAIATQITSLGANLLIVSPGQRVPGGGGGGGGVPQFTEEDALSIQSQIGGVAAVAPQGRLAVTVVANGRNWATTVSGSSNEWFSTGNWQLASGRVFEDEEQRAGAAVCVIGETVRRELQGGMGDQDDTVLLPLHTLQRRVTGSRKVSTLLVSMEDGSDATRLKASLRQLMRERRRLGESGAGGLDDNFNIFDTQQLAQTLASTMGVLTQLLGAVAAVSLLVGGIGIMNIMLVSVTERTREIGLRLAVGALEQEVLLQFLIEAVVLSALGGLVGVVLAVGASFGLSRLMGVAYEFDLGINLLALLFSAFIGVVFGYFPARRAARMDPIEALRHE